MLAAEPSLIPDWLTHVMGTALPFVIALAKMWQKFMQRIDKMERRAEAAEAALEECTRQYQALHRSVDKIKDNVASFDRRIGICEDRTDRAERERSITSPVGYPVQPARPIAEPMRRRQEETKIYGDITTPPSGVVKHPVDDKEDP